MDDNAWPHWTLVVQELLESEYITRMDWPAYFPDLNPIEHLWDALGRRFSSRLHHPENTQQLKQMLIDEWASYHKKYESRFDLWDHNGRIRVRRYVGERCLPESERHSGLTLGFMVCSAISYHRRSNFLRIEGIPGAIFLKDNARPHVAKIVRDFFSVQHIQLLPWPAYSADMSPIEHVWDLVGRRLAHDSRPSPS
ncbi:transposable element Tcb1 transposase [Trichonephila clavipes]|nr:transposable element Tcb1 transposase [Trichonephila clavipes]